MNVPNALNGCLHQSQNMYKRLQPLKCQIVVGLSAVHLEADTYPITKKVNVSALRSSELYTVNVLMGQLLIYALFFCLSLIFFPTK